MNTPHSGDADTCVLKLLAIMETLNVSSSGMILMTRDDAKK
jgi:hypothetical protein